MRRHAELAYEKDVERHLQLARNFGRHRYAAPREREDENVAAARVLRQAFGELAAGVGPIVEQHGETPPHLYVRATATLAAWPFTPGLRRFA